MVEVLSSEAPHSKWDTARLELYPTVSAAASSSISLVQRK
jgi:hypothetical protein